MNEAKSELDLKHENEVQQIVERVKGLENESIAFNKNDIIISEGEKAHVIYFIIEGQAVLVKHRHIKKNDLIVERFGPGDFIGLTAFLTNEPSILEARAITELKCLRLIGIESGQWVHENPEITEMLNRLFISKLSIRTRKLINLTIEVGDLGDELEQKNNDLKYAMKKLEQAQNRMVHREKLATLGQLLAGIAHEINNPCASLSRGVDSLSNGLESLFDNTPFLDKFEHEKKMLQAGLECPFWSSETKREKIEKISDDHPSLKRPFIKRLARLDDNSLASLNLKLKNNFSELETIKVSHLLDFYEMGTYLRTVSLSTERIQKLVISLKNYGKQDQDNWEVSDIREGIENTLTVLNNKLKHYKVELILNPIDKIYCNGGEINQVWTNLIMNACHATDLGGEILIKTEQIDNHIVVTIADNGHGIEEGLLEQIFETNFTTKNTRSEFGIGLGLAISREIVKKHNGQISVKNRNSGGACFTVIFPLDISPSDGSESSYFF